MTLSSNFALKRGGGRNNEGGVTTREYGTCTSSSARARALVWLTDDSCAIARAWNHYGVGKSVGQGASGSSSGARARGGGRFTANEELRPAPQAQECRVFCAVILGRAEWCGRCGGCLVRLVMPLELSSRSYFSSSSSFYCPPLLLLRLLHVPPPPILFSSGRGSSTREAE